VGEEMTNLQQQQQIYLSANRNKITEFENYMMTLSTGVPVTPNTIVQVVNDKFYEWEFLLTYNKIYGYPTLENNYEALLNSWMFDMKDSWNEKRNSFFESWIWNYQVQKNEVAFERAKINYPSYLNKTQQTTIGNLVSKGLGFFGEIGTFLTIGLIVYGIGVLKK
jgi:hypothetical protein